ncbi:MAG: DUF6310 domain-containing protein [Hyalangium sp.]|uniref:DUF6310 domain-containing protein n=1 Tax=Hyalangium sp. TaxID=2028555 RepID=UPI00389A3BED
MSIRIGSALLFLLGACATTEPRESKPKQYNQEVVPWVEPLVAPRSVAPVLPAPGLSPPITVIVDPHAHPQQEPQANPAPERSGSNKDPPAPVVSDPRPECIPYIKPHLGGDPLHNQCADKVPQNGFPGFDVLVNGKHFDALQIRAGILWEVKTDNFDTYTATLQGIVIGNQVPELRREREIARACGYDFVVGVRSAAHRAALLAQVPTLNIVVMEWC